MVDECPEYGVGPLRMKTDGTDGTDFEQSGSGLEAPSLDGVREHLHVRLGL